MNFAAAKEMSPYLEEPKAMPVGTPGKMGYLFWDSNSTTTAGRSCAIWNAMPR
ncbi:MAG: hypothetical protein ACLSH3_14830 [Alistipes finegoldii]